MREKLKGLSFIEPHVCYVVDIIDAALKRMPDKGIISGADLLLLHGLVNLLQDGDALLNHSQQIIDGYGPATVLDEILRQTTSENSPAMFNEEQENEKDEDNMDSFSGYEQAHIPQSMPSVVPMEASPQAIPSMGLF